MVRKKDYSIKIEKFIVVRNNNKRVIAKKPYNKKTYAFDVRTYKENRTFNKHKRVTKLTNVTETTYDVKERKRASYYEISDGKKKKKNYFVDNDIKQNKKRTGKYQYIVTGTTDNGKKITGYSNSYNMTVPTKVARDEAYYNLYRVVSGIYTKKSDADEGEELSQKKFTIINERIRFYS